MNERIKELANQLGPVATIGNWGRVDWADNVYPQLGDKMYAAIDLAEFAELIVRECIEIVKPCRCGCCDGEPEGIITDTIIKQITEHFGVEE